MKTETRKMLSDFIGGIPNLKRQLNPDFSNFNDERRLTKVAINLLDNNDTIDTSDIKSVCETVGGDEYLSLISDELFLEEFAHPIYSRIDDIKNIISTYRKIQSE